MMQILDVDVILLSWDRSQMTLETVQSLLEQKEVNLRIWIVDQGSKPEELKRLKDATREYKNIYIEELTHNIGVPAGRNVGTRLGTAPYTVSIDNDAVFESPIALKQVIERFEQNPKVGIISFRIKNFYTGQDDELSWVYPKSLKAIKDQSFVTTRFVGCGHAIRRETFEQVRGYDDALFFYWEEVDFAYRAINSGYELIYAPEISVLHKVSPEARVRWENKRFYYHVRNGIYINLKYNQNIWKALILAIGYTVKGTYNGLLQQVFPGILDGVRMGLGVRTKLPSSLLRLNNAARNYIWEHETRYRGSFFNRLRTEVFASLPGRD
jgi:GT2 family glycosyltransferase